MEKLLEKAWASFMGRADEMTTWVGAIGLFLQFIGWQSGLFFLFVALLVLPDARFSETFKEWTKKIREGSK